MAAATSPQHQGQSVSSLDELFTILLKDLLQNAISLTSECTAKVLVCSKSFLDKDTSDLVNVFHELYFGHDKINSQRERMNENVDQLIDHIQSNIDQGIQAESGIEELDQSSEERLALAGVQKKLEAKITMDQSVRDQLMPALASMQFEDMVKQRIEHLQEIWCEVGKVLASNGSLDDKFARGFINHLSSTQERSDFYQFVLRESAPAGMESGNSLLFT